MLSGSKQSENARREIVPAICSTISSWVVVIAVLPLLVYDRLMSLGHEWDWPPERRRHARRRYQTTMDAFPRRTGWAHPIVTRIVDVYFRIVVTFVKMMLGAIGGAIVVGCVWLAFAIFGH